MKDRTGRLFAMKYFRYAQAPTQQQYYFLKGIEVIVRVNHPSLLPLAGYSLPSSGERTATILAEFMPNRLFTEGRQLDLTVKLLAIFGIAGGMAYLHLKGITHNNLRPSHIFLNADSEPLVGNFGLSQLPTPIDTRTPSLAVLAHTPPEVLQGGTPDAKADVFAFGILVWEIIVGQFAFSGFSDQTSIVAHIVEGGRPSLESAIPSAFASLLERCWSSDPSSRPDFQTIIAELSADDFILPNSDDTRLRSYRSRVFNRPEKPTAPPDNDDDDLIARQQQQIDELRATYTSEIEALRAVVVELRALNTELRAATRNLQRELKAQTDALTEHTRRMKSYATDLTNAGLHAKAFREKQQRLAASSRKGTETIELEAADLRENAARGRPAPRNPAPTILED
jgi:serine/threonine protein kinase